MHWSSSHARNNYGEKAIFYSRTKDFKEFSKPEILYEWKEHDIIDSALYEEDGSYYLFVKCGQNPARILLLRSDEITGPYTRIEAFDKSMETIEEGKYEAAKMCIRDSSYFIATTGSVSLETVKQYIESQRSKEHQAKSCLLYTSRCV